MGGQPRWPPAAPPRRWACPLTLLLPADGSPVAPGILAYSEQDLADALKVPNAVIGLKSHIVPTGAVKSDKSLFPYVQYETTIGERCWACMGPCTRQGTGREGLPFSAQALRPKVRARRAAPLRLRLPRSAFSSAGAPPMHACLCILGAVNPRPTRALLRPSHTTTAVATPLQSACATRARRCRRGRTGAPSAPLTPSGSGRSSTSRPATPAPAARA